jgi:hypothetical protein
MGMPWAIFSLKVCSNGVLDRTRVGEICRSIAHAICFCMKGFAMKGFEF